MATSSGMDGAMKHVKEALDLCLACKGCKGDCPVNVDMATYKAEFLAHYWEGGCARLRLCVRMDRQMGAPCLDCTRICQSVHAVARLARRGKMAVGVPPQRQIPAFAAQTFQSWFRKVRSATQDSSGLAPKYSLADTFNNYFMPETAQAAVEILEHAGCSVEVLDQHLCCGGRFTTTVFSTWRDRTSIAISTAHSVPTSRRYPMVVLEPSCCSVFRDELRNLFPESSARKSLPKIHSRSRNF